MDLLVLADSDGVVDMTMEAISRRTNVPFDQVSDAIAALCAPDARSNSPNEGGRRLLRVDENKPWGWQIVNYHHYRAIRDEERRREYFREYRRKEREQKRPKKKNGSNGNLVDSNGKKITLCKKPPTSTMYPFPPPEHSEGMEERF